MSDTIKGYLETVAKPYFRVHGVCVDTSDCPYATKETEEAEAFIASLLFSSDGRVVGHTTRPALKQSGHTVMIDDICQNNYMSNDRNKFDTPTLCDSFSPLVVNVQNSSISESVSRGHTVDENDCNNRNEGIYDISTGIIPETPPMEETVDQEHAFQYVTFLGAGYNDNHHEGENEMDTVRQCNQYVRDKSKGNEASCSGSGRGSGYGHTNDGVDANLTKNYRHSIMQQAQNNAKHRKHAGNVKNDYQELVSAMERARSAEVSQAHGSINWKLSQLKKQQLIIKASLMLKRKYKKQKQRKGKKLCTFMKPIITLNKHHRAYLDALIVVCPMPGCHKVLKNSYNLKRHWLDNACKTFGDIPEELCVFIDNDMR